MFAFLRNSPQTCLLVLFLAALGLRCYGLLDESMTHYDEYYYANSGFWVIIDEAGAREVMRVAAQSGLLNGDPPARMALLHPMLPLHSPLLYPTLTGIAYWIAGGPWYAGGAIVSALLGALTVLPLYGLGRRFLDPEWALLAAALLAFSDLHTAYSRMWLVDSCFGFFFTVSMYALMRAADAGGLRWWLIAGVATGLAWNTKYNGWMPLAIAATTGVCAVIRQRCGRETETSLSRIRGCAGLLTALVIAGAMFAPWYLFVERHFPGGFAQVRSHHRLFTDVPNAWQEAPNNLARVPAAAGTWFDNAARLCRELPAYRHAAWAVTLIGLIAAGLVSVRRGRLQAAVCLGVAILCGAVAGTDLLLLLAGGLAGLHCLCARRVGLAPLLLCVWLGSFLLLVPYYHAYSRLLVPALPAAALLVATLCQSRPAPHPSRRMLTIGLIAVALPAAASARWSVSEWRGAASTRVHGSHYRELADYIAARTPRNAVVIAHTQPCFWFLFDRDHKAPLDEAVDLSAFANVPCFIAVDFTIHSRPIAREWLIATGPRLKEVARLENRLPPPSLFNFPEVTPHEYWAAMQRLANAANDDSTKAPRLPGPVDALEPGTIVLFEVLPK